MSSQPEMTRNALPRGNKLRCGAIRNLCKIYRIA